MAAKQIHVRRILAALIGLLSALAFTPAIAQAGVSAGATVTFPTTVTVGQTGQAASISLTNFNTPPNAADTNSVCNAGEASPPCAAPEQGIVLVPSCKQVAGGQCTAAGADPGVFQVSPTATGRLNSACAGMPFTTSIISATFGTVRFTPQAAGTHVTLPGFGATCTIDFTFSVLKSPTGDVDPAIHGNQTAQATEHTQFAGVFGPGALNNHAHATSYGTTVLRAGPPVITTLASGDIALGGQLADQATVSGLVNPVVGATVTFRLYPPSAPSCTGTALFTNIKPVTLNGSTATATSDAYAPAEAGVYHWIATYDGDVNNLAASGACGESTETRTVNAPPPPPSECSNGRDDDGDGMIDARDPQCAAGRGQEASKDNPILACSGRALTLTDVLPAGRRVRLGGLADPTLAGKTVQLLVGSRVVARTTVRRDGSFATTSAAPTTAGARFAARIDNLRSNALKLDRKTIDARVTHSAGHVTLTATVNARRRGGARVELLLRRACGPYRTLATANLPRNGRLRIRLPNAATTATGTIVVRARIRLSGGRTTYTLPRAITLP